MGDSVCVLVCVCQCLCERTWCQTTTAAAAAPANRTIQSAEHNGRMDERSTWQCDNLITWLTCSGWANRVENTPEVAPPSLSPSSAPQTWHCVLCAVCVVWLWCVQWIWINELSAWVEWSLKGSPHSKMAGQLAARNSAVWFGFDWTISATTIIRRLRMKAKNKK